MFAYSIFSLKFFRCEKLVTRHIYVIKMTSLVHVITLDILFSSLCKYLQRAVFKPIFYDSNLIFIFFLQTKTRRTRKKRWQEEEL